MNNKDKTKKILVCSCVVILLCGVGTLLVGIVGFLVYPQSERAQRREGYMTSYNYEGLTEPPWLYADEDLSEFDEQTEILKLVEGEIPTSFYEEVMEADVNLDDIEVDGIKTGDEKDYKNYIINNQLGYKFDAGEYKDTMYELIGTPNSDFDDNTAIYCITTSDEYFIDYYCDVGYAAVFAIYRYTVSEYEELVAFYDDGGGIPFEILYQNETYYWVLQRAEYGTIPDDAYLYEAFYRVLRNSFTIL